ncbi:MAG: hypothetical protein U0R71_16445 [Solirubrobacterales bacterium]
MQADVQPVAGQCFAGPTQTSTYDQWFFSKVAPGEDYITEGSSSKAYVETSFTNTESYEDFCPGHYRLTSGPQTISVPGSQTANMEPGCYQSTVFEAGIYFPQDPSAQQIFDSLSGTLGTLQVGDGPACAPSNPGASPTVRKKIKRKETVCYQLNDRFDGEVHKKFGSSSPYKKWKELNLVQDFRVYVKGVAGRFGKNPHLPPNRLRIDKFVFAGAQGASVGANPKGVALYFDSYLTGEGIGGNWEVGFPFSISGNVTHTSETGHFSSGHTNSKLNLKFVADGKDNPVRGKASGITETHFRLKGAAKLGSEAAPINVSSKAKVPDEIDLDASDGSSSKGHLIKCSEIDWNN